MMQAAIFNGVGRALTVERIACPKPGPGEVLIRVQRCGICGSDLHMTEDPIFCIPVGAVLGHEFTGEIVELGRDVENLKIGDRVSVVPISSCGRCAACLSGKPVACAEMKLHGGGYAEYTAVHERQCVRLPSTVGVKESALVEPLAVGLHGVIRAEMKPGARILVIGVGPVGLATIFWARRLGAGLIAATASSMARAEMALGMGADIFLDPEDAGPKASALALGGPPDIVFECVGKPGLIQLAIDHVRPRGTVLVLGLCTTQDTFMPFGALNKEVRLQMAAFYDIADFTRAVDALDRGATEPSAMITNEVSLSDMPEAFEKLKRRTHQCKVLVKP
ncbi:alcohol dehydrogenase catalytic domain-containing protein [Bradyrhizobium diazoefficiens]|uniref:alcohol dehydrogenase catalytic domain-containing protein n=1 Tax=Bradyrhizobium diazoefficiens TaxID=1355477 RepID=UPI001B8B5420|nr:alcohol dehydrogenase catalytic domain-containing protein [Bradyrhizobium diazoefficiens]MBR0863511.1 alcohol dehydrogenase catalytic domain-containing protein [Bradyrhizobium diazoefficiens]MBR0888196.1 alcohol dehydrogenase catalytic domain-containing protein [Bradyrhizobium diazoefficiens]MBR0919837.1 alcohol dehydrogenase catalytic domain-containing protein [Bradyrhizobium diazoefficiens]